MLLVRLLGFLLLMSTPTPRPLGLNLNNFLGEAKNAMRLLASPRTGTPVAKKVSSPLIVFHLYLARFDYLRAKRLTPGCGEPWRSLLSSAVYPWRSPWNICSGNCAVHQHSNLPSQLHQSQQNSVAGEGDAQESSPWAGGEGTSIRSS